MLGDLGFESEETDDAGRRQVSGNRHRHRQGQTPGERLTGEMGDPGVVLDPKACAMSTVAPISSATRIAMMK